MTNFSDTIEGKKIIDNNWSGMRTVDVERIADLSFEAGQKAKGIKDWGYNGDLKGIEFERVRASERTKTLDEVEICVIKLHDRDNYFAQTLSDEDLCKHNLLGGVRALGDVLEELSNLRGGKT